MIYSDVRPQVKNGDILAWRGTNFLARLIKWVTHGSYSHVAVAYWLEDRLMIVQEHEFFGQQIVPLSGNLPCDWIAANVVLTDAAKTAMFEKLGSPYNYIDALKIGLGLKASAGGAICSTFATSVLDLCGKSYPAASESPSSLVAALARDGAPVNSLTIAR